jgi:hypothetical protein
MALKKMALPPVMTAVQVVGHRRRRAARVLGLAKRKKEATVILRSFILRVEKGK